MNIDLYQHVAAISHDLLGKGIVDIVAYLGEQPTVTSHYVRIRDERTELKLWVKYKGTMSVVQVKLTSTAWTITDAE